VDEVIPEDPDDPWFVCIACDTTHTRRSAPNPVRFGDFMFCSVMCERRWVFYGHHGMS
jgi:hypothetical protein